MGSPVVPYSDLPQGGVVYSDLPTGATLAPKQTVAPPTPTQSALQRVLGDHPIVGPLSTALDHIIGAGKGLANAVTPETPTENVINTMPGALPVYKALIKPSIDAISQARAQSAAGNRGLNLLNDTYDAQGNYQPTGVSSLLDAIPVAGPMARSIENDAHKKGALSALTGAATDIGIGEATGALGRRIAGPSMVPGQNYTPQQLAAHTGILGRMNGLGDNFIPQDSAASTGSVIRQAAADNPSLAQAATVKGSTPNNIAALQAILQKANTNLEVPHAATIAQHANVPADVSGVQAAVGQSFPSTLSGVSPEDASAIQQLQGRLGTINTLGGLNDLRQWLNDEAAAGYKQDGIAAARGTATKQGIRTAADAARNAYYDQLQQASGIDFRPLKAQQSALLDQQEGAAKLGQTLSAQQAVADEPKSPGARVGEVLTGGRALKAGPIAGTAQLAAEKLLGQTPLTQPNYLIRKFLSNLPEPNPQTAAPVSAGPTQPPIAGNLPANATPPTVQGTPLPQPPPASPQPALPAPQLQLPAGVDPRLLEEMASPSAPQAPQTPYPALNPNTARTRIAPTQFASPEIIPPSGARPVTPSGQVMTPIQRFLQAGDLGSGIVDPSVDDLKRAIANMRNKRGK